MKGKNSRRCQGKKKSTYDHRLVLRRATRDRGSLKKKKLRPLNAKGGKGEINHKPRLPHGGDADYRPLPT